MSSSRLLILVKYFMLFLLFREPFGFVHRGYMIT
nr:MAG TPA: hypothetical protein [Caudoviricetes sp.]